jgi:RNA polymerase sigma factor (sigma-70 family)
MQRERDLHKTYKNVVDDKDDYALAQMVRAEFFQEVYKEIEELPRMQKTTLKMFFIEGLKTDEIAKRLGLTLEAVRGNKSKALKQLRNSLLNKKLLPFVAVYLSYYHLAGFSTLTGSTPNR